jgi:hypothetical protein
MSDKGRVRGRYHFTRNFLVTILPELRAGLAIFDSGAVGLVELPDSSP